MTPPLNGLILWWDMETLTSDGRMKDFSPSAHHGTLIGSPAIVPGHIGNAMASDVMVYVRSAASVAGETGLKYTGGDLTLCCWFNPSSLETNGGNILSKPWHGCGSYNYRIYYGTDRKLTVFLTGTNGVGGTSNSWSSPPTANAYPAGAWYPLCLVLSSDSKVRLWVGGNLVIDTTHTITNWTPLHENIVGCSSDISDENIAFLAGGLWPYDPPGNLTASFYFTGILDEVLVYSRQLTTSEILSLAGQLTFPLSGTARSIATRRGRQSTTQVRPPKSFNVRNR